MRITILKEGFSFIELLIYLPCALVLLGAAGYSTLNFQKALLSLTASTETTIQIALAMDQFINDLKKTSSCFTQWKSCEPHSLIFKTERHDIGWKHYKNRLIRISGDYCTQTGRWKGAARTTFLDPMEQFECTISYDGEKIKGILCKMTKKCRAKVCTINSFTALEEKV